MRDLSPNAQALREQVFALVPDFDWCGGCARATRALTEEEAGKVTAWVAAYSRTELAQRDMLAGLCWFMEVYNRGEFMGPCRCPRRQPTVPSKGFFLYRLWADDGRLLYVGVSVRLASRLRSHKRRWGELISRVTWEEHADEASMLAAEREAIREEDPAFNKACVG